MARIHVVTEPASRDIRQIAYHIRDREGGRVAARVSSRIHETFEFLAENPGVGHYRADLNEEHHRCWPLWSYLIVYDPTATPLRILRVLHGARDMRTLMGE